MIGMFCATVSTRFRFHHNFDGLLRSECFNFFCCRSFSYLAPILTNKSCSYVRTIYLIFNVKQQKMNEKKLEIQFARAARWKKRMFPRWFLCPVSNNSSRAATCCKWHIKKLKLFARGIRAIENSNTKKKDTKFQFFFLFPAKRCSAWTAFVLIIGLWRALVLPARPPRSTGSSN